MPYITTPERYGREEGLAKAADGIEVALKLKFGPSALWLMPEIRQIKDKEKLETILHAVETAASPTICTDVDRLNP